MDFEFQINSMNKSPQMAASVSNQTTNSRANTGSSDGFFGSVGVVIFRKLTSKSATFPSNSNFTTRTPHGSSAENR